MNSNIEVIPDIGECADLGYIRFAKGGGNKFPEGYSFPRSFLPLAMGLNLKSAACPVNDVNDHEEIDECHKCHECRGTCPECIPCDGEKTSIFVLRGGDCVLCSAEAELIPGNGFAPSKQTVTVVAIMLFVPLVLYVLYHFVSSAWRPSNRTGVECIVLSGQCEDSKPSETLKKRLAAHLDVVEGEVKVDHAGAELQPGDDVLVEGGADTRARRNCKKVELNGHVGTVLECKEDTAKVCVHGFSGTWVLPLESLKIQALFVETPQDAPA